MSNPKLSEIRLQSRFVNDPEFWTADALTDEKKIVMRLLAETGIPHLLELVERLGELAEKLMKATKVEEMGMGRRTFHISDSALKECCEKARVLLEELEL